MSSPRTINDFKKHSTPVHSWFRHRKKIRCSDIIPHLDIPVQSHGKCRSSKFSAFGHKFRIVIKKKKIKNSNANSDGTSSLLSKAPAEKLARI